MPTDVRKDPEGRHKRVSNAKARRKRAEAKASASNASLAPINWRYNEYKAERSSARSKAKTSKLSPEEQAKYEALVAKMKAWISSTQTV